MMSLYPETLFQGQPLSNYHSFLYGPVCVATDYRGTGILQGLFQKLLAQVALRYNVGVAFVAKDNPRSLLGTDLEAKTLTLQAISHYARITWAKTLINSLFKFHIMREPTHDNFYLSTTDKKI